MQLWGGQESMASRGQKASCACSYGCIKQGMKYSNMADHYFEESCSPRHTLRNLKHLSAPVMHAHWRLCMALQQMSKKMTFIMI